MTIMIMNGDVVIYFAICRLKLKIKLKLLSPLTVLLRQPTVPLICAKN